MARVDWSGSSHRGGMLNQRSGRVPNPLTFGAIGAAWAVAAFLAGSGASAGGLSSSVICTFAALGAMLPAYCAVAFPPAASKPKWPSAPGLAVPWRWGRPCIPR